MCACDRERETFTHTHSQTEIERGWERERENAPYVVSGHEHTVAATSAPGLAAGHRIPFTNVVVIAGAVRASVCQPCCGSVVREERSNSINLI